MSKPATVVLGVAGAIALVSILAVFALGAKRQGQAPSDTRDPTSAAMSSEPPPAAAKRASPASSPLPVSLVAGPRLRKPAQPDVDSHLDEVSLLAKLHDLAASDPPLSLQLAREAVARFPESPNAPEFAWNVVKALANMGRRKEAEDEARIMVRKYPGNYFAGDVERHLLNHPPNPQ